jgi:hypothetical protein
VRRPLVLACALAAGWLASGCFGNSETVFPPGLEPWESPNTAMAPEPTADEPYPEVLVFQRTRWNGSIPGMHARAYVHADVQTTFDAVRHPLSGADRHDNADFSWEYGVDPEYTYSHRSTLRIEYTAGFFVEFQLTWRSGVVEMDEMGVPTVTATRWQKTFGTDSIPLLEGSIVCTRVEDDVTELQIQYHLEATASDHGTIEDYLTLYYASILAYAHGEVANPDELESWPAQ